MKLCVVWKFHQPSGWHATQRQFTLPWTRIHTLRCLLPFLQLTEEFPGVLLTLAVSPAVLRQLEQVTLKAVRESLLDIHWKPAAELRPAEIVDLVGLGFSATPEPIVRPFPRWLALRERWEQLRKIDSRFIETLSRDELQDLQALVQLGWLDAALQNRVPEILRKARVGETLLPEDARSLAGLQSEAMLECLQLLRGRCRSGDLEYLGASLHNAPLPLLMGEAGGFNYPEDARTQMMRGPRIHFLNFGERPAVVCLPEGALSAQAAAMLPRAGVEFAVASSRVLRKSLGRIPTNEELCSRWDYQGASLIFSETATENQMLFVYPHFSAAKSVSDLKSRIEAIAQACVNPNTALAIEVDLVAAGPFDSMEKKEFWRGILGMLSSAKDTGVNGVQGSTVKGALRSMPSQTLGSLRASSRRARGFASWSEAEKPFYWRALKHSRERFQNVRAWKTLAPEQLIDAKASILALESVDWMAAMEPGLDAFTQRKTEELFRAHLDCVTRRLNLSRPMWFAQPLLPLVVTVTSISPSQPVTPVLDGKVSSSHSWSGSGFFRNREEGGQARDPLRQLSGVYFGADGRNAYLRVALPAPAREMLRSFEIQGVFHPREEEHVVSWFRIALSPEGATHLDVRLAVPGMVRASDKPQAAVDDLADLSLPLSGLGSRLGDVLRFQVSLWEHGNAVASAPTLGWEEFTVEDHVTYEGDVVANNSSANWGMEA
ncbi:MAG: hypothetical protein LC114_07085 [Bryobacterales bacterium]|nr:hypothetical protein [Bryobacterales bacterium]